MDDDIELSSPFYWVQKCIFMTFSIRLQSVPEKNNFLKSVERIGELIS